MGDIIKDSLNEIYKKPFRVLTIFLLNLLVIFGINRSGLIVEVFTIFVPAIFGILFIKKNSYKPKKWIDILVNSLIFILFFMLNTYFRYNYLDFFYENEFISELGMIILNAAALTLDVFVSVFVIGIFYSAVKDLKYKIAVIDMFKYFSEKSSTIFIIFYGLFWTMFLIILIFYGLNDFVCYSIVNIIFLLFAVIFFSFLMILFKNFLISEKKDKIILQVKGKSFGFHIKSILSVEGAVVVSSIIMALYLVIFCSFPNEISFALGVILFLLLITMVEMIILKILLKLNEKIVQNSITKKKFCCMFIMNLINILFIGLVVFLTLLITSNFAFIIYNPVIIYSLLFIILTYLRLIFNFQLVGIFIEKPFKSAFKEGFTLTSKFMNLKTFIILMGQAVFLSVNILNGMFSIVIWAWNFLISSYLIYFYVKENDKEIIKNI